MKTLLLFVIAILAGCATPQAQDWVTELRKQIEVKWPDPSAPFPEQPVISADILAEVGGRSLLERPVFVKVAIHHDPAPIEKWLKAELSGAGWPEAMRRVDIVNHLPALSEAPSEIDGAIGTALRARLGELFLENKHIVVAESCHECFVVEPHVVLFRLPADRRIAYYGFVALVTYRGQPVAKSRQWAMFGRVPGSPNFSEKRPVLGIGRVLEYETREVVSHVLAGSGSAVGATQ